MYSVCTNNSPPGSDFRTTLTSMTGGPSAVEVVTTDAAGVTERAQGVAQLQGLHRDELPSVRSVRITIGADRDAWNMKAK